ncbi:MAG TPA: oligosaccharide flippase family protein, partial [Candidatus Omnitrophota bacterium]|nr:oligosaccharide flippase family protein [Candidatus Omnitrophota bacterium]
MKKLIKDYVSVIFGMGLSRGISFATFLMLVRVLTIDGFGRFSMFFTVMMLIWQLPNSVDAIYVRYVKAGKEAERVAYLRTALIMKLWTLLFVCISAYPLGRLLCEFFFQKPDMTAFVSLAIVSGGFLSIFSSLSGIFQAEEKFVMYSIINIVFYAVLFLSVGWFFARDIALSLLDVTLMFGVVAVTVGIGAGTYLLVKVRTQSEPGNAHFRVMFDFGKWIFAETLVYVILQRLDILFLARFAAYPQIGIYSAAVRIAMIASIMTSAATAIFMPRGCGSLRSDSHLRKYFKEASAVTAVLCAMIAVLMSCTPVLVHRLFGYEYAAAIPAARILLLEAIFVLLYTPFSFLFYAGGQTKKVFAVGLVRLSVMITGLSVLVPRFGPTGASLAIAVSSF